MRLCLLLGAAVCLLAQQARDLKLEKDDPIRRDAPAKPSIPRSYALVIGIGNYRNLPANAQLQFPEKDAEANDRMSLEVEVNTVWEEKKGVGRKILRIIW